MVTSSINFQSEDETMTIDISKNDEYGWDVEIHQFPMGSLAGSYNDIQKMIEDIRPFTYRLSEEDRIAFADQFNKII